MKYTCDIEINLPLEQVIALFDNPDNLHKWMEGLESFTHISGKAGEVGAKSKLVFKTKRGIFTMIETITVKNLPDEFTGTYEVDNVDNLVRNRFVKLSENKTHYICESEFQFKGIMKFLSIFMGSMFKKQTMEHLNSFKRFAESTAE